MDTVGVGSVSSWPQFAPDEIDSVVEVLRSGSVNYWTGEHGRRFEQEFAAYCGAPHALAVANGTAALELALYALRIGEGDEVVVTPRTFFASVSAVIKAGARPVFADVDRVSQNITAETIASVLTPRTRAVIAVHLAGWPCEMREIMALADRHGLLVIEDCAQAHGAEIEGKRVGSFGHAAAFSFCQDKIMTTGGEGGMVLLSDENAWERAWAQRDHGKSPRAVGAKANDGRFEWLIESVGTNWRLTEMQSAIGRVQLAKLDGWLTARRANADAYTARLQAMPSLRVTRAPDNIRHAYYKYYAFTYPERVDRGCSRDRILSELRARQVPCFTGACPEVYLERALAASAARPRERLPVARELGETSLMFPVDPTWNPPVIDRCCDVIDDVLSAVAV